MLLLCLFVGNMWCTFSYISIRVSLKFELTDMKWKFSVGFQKRYTASPACNGTISKNNKKSYDSDWQEASRRHPVSKNAISWWNEGAKRWRTNSKLVLHYYRLHNRVFLLSLFGHSRSMFRLWGSEGFAFEFVCANAPHIASKLLLLPWWK